MSKAKKFKRGDSMRFDSPMWAVYASSLGRLMQTNDGDPIIFAARKDAVAHKMGLPGCRIVRLRIEGVIQ